ncbi:hypothetical protein [Brumimicrobium sp.]|uniref:hypothetical protein n=1 Tax=Brumimicrobium sp. TaxID=2029867 RepID=UPI002B5B2281|nr:hypothetical protein [Flavobacterium sp.]
MTKYTLTLSLVFLLQLVLSQESELKNIPGSRVFLVIPGGFKISKSTTGIEKSENVGIIVMDLRGGNFSSNAATFTEANWKSKADTVLCFKEYKIQGFSAKKVQIQSSGMNFTALIFGDSTFSAMMTGMAPIGDKSSIKQIEQALNSVKYDKTLKINSLKIAKFKLNTDKSPYKFAQHSSSMYIFTKYGEQTSEWDELSLVVSELPFEVGFTVEGLAQQAIIGLTNNGFEYEKLLSERSLVLNNIQAFELEVAGKMNEKDVIVYLLTLAKGDNSFTLMGIAKNDLKLEISEFKELARTIQLKY